MWPRSYWSLRNGDLRKAARGLMCQVRIPGYCNTIPKRLCWRITDWRERAERRKATRYAGSDCL